VNFWPAKNIDEYLNLQGRIEKRMAAMTIAGSQIPKDFTENIGKISRSDELEKKQIEKNLKIMQNSLEEIEPENFGLNNLSLENFRQDLTKESAEKYKNFPNGIFSGFKAKQKGLIALLQHKKSKERKLIFINEDGKEILLNQSEILQFLRNNKDKERYVPRPIEECEKQEIEKYSDFINIWFKNSIKSEAEKIENSLLDGTISLSSINANTETVQQKFESENWNLICWEVISNES
jgi:hypothetical protein